MPAWVNLKLNVWPGDMVPLPKALLSLVTVCGALLLFFHMIVVPTEIDSAFGLNENWLLPTIMIVTVFGGGGGGVGVGGLGVGLGLGLGVVVGVALVGTGVGVGLVGIGVGVVPARVGVGLG